MIMHIFIYTCSEDRSLIDVQDMHLCVNVVRCILEYAMYMWAPYITIGYKCSYILYGAWMCKLCVNFWDTGIRTQTDVWGDVTYWCMINYFRSCMCYLQIPASRYLCADSAVAGVQLCWCTSALCVYLLEICICVIVTLHTHTHDIGKQYFYV